MQSLKLILNLFINHIEYQNRSINGLILVNGCCILVNGDHVLVVLCSILDDGCRVLVNEHRVLVVLRSILDDGCRVLVNEHRVLVMLRSILDDGRRVLVNEHRVLVSLFKKGASKQGVTFGGFFRFGNGGHWE